MLLPSHNNSSFYLSTKKNQMLHFYLLNSTSHYNCRIIRNWYQLCKWVPIHPCNATTLIPTLFRWSFLVQFHSGASIKSILGPAGYLHSSHSHRYQKRLGAWMLILMFVHKEVATERRAQTVPKYAGWSIKWNPPEKFKSCTTSPETAFWSTPISWRSPFCLINLSI